MEGVISGRDCPSSDGYVLTVTDIVLVKCDTLCVRN